MKIISKLPTVPLLCCYVSYTISHTHIHTLKRCDNFAAQTWSLKSKSKQGSWATYVPLCLHMPQYNHFMIKILANANILLLYLISSHETTYKLLHLHLVKTKWLKAVCLGSSSSSSSNIKLLKRTLTHFDFSRLVLTKCRCRWSFLRENIFILKWYNR